MILVTRSAWLRYSIAVAGATLLGTACSEEEELRPAGSSSVGGAQPALGGAAGEPSTSGDTGSDGGSGASAGAGGELDAGASAGGQAGQNSAQSGAGGADEAPASAGGAAGSNELPIQQNTCLAEVSHSAGHQHVMHITREQVDAGKPQVYSLGGDHEHLLFLDAADFATLALHSTLHKTSTASAPGPHTHDVVISCDAQ